MRLLKLLFNLSQGIGALYGYLVMLFFVSSASEITSVVSNVQKAVITDIKIKNYEQGNYNILSSLPLPELFETKTTSDDDSKSGRDYALPIVKAPDYIGKMDEMVAQQKAAGVDQVSAVNSVANNFGQTKASSVDRAPASQSSPNLRQEARPEVRPETRPESHSDIARNMVNESLPNQNSQPTTNTPPRTSPPAVTQATTVTQPPVETPESAPSDHSQASSNSTTNSTQVTTPVTPVVQTANNTSNNSSSSSGGSSGSSGNSGTGSSVSIASNTAEVISIYSGNNQSAAVASSLTPLIVTVLDSNGNAVSGETIDWSSSGGTLSFSSTTTNGLGLSSNTFTLGTILGSYTVTAKIHGTSISKIFNQTATFGAIDNFTFTSVPLTASVAQPFIMTITAKDHYNNTITNYTGTIQFTSTSSNATLPVDYTFSSSDQGVQQSTFALDDVGTQTISVNQSGSPAINGTSSTITVIPISGLIAAYGFSEGESNSVSDQSGNNHPLTLNSIGWTNAGHSGDSIVLTSSTSSYGLYDNSSQSLSFTNSFSIMSWVYPTIDPLSGENSLITLYSDSNLEHWPIQIELFNYHEGGLPTCYSGTNTGGNFVRGVSKIPTNTWTHIACVRDFENGVFTLYINGVASSSVAANGVPSIDTSVPNYLYIGQDPADQTFLGKMDDVRIFNTAVSSSQLTYLMNNAVGPTIASSKSEVATGDTATISATGGVAPYSFSLVSGPGSVSGALYTATASTGFAIVRATDSLGQISDKKIASMGTIYSWSDADSMNTLFSNNQTITHLDAKSGTVNYVTAPTPSNPTFKTNGPNGKGYIHFDGTQCLLSQNSYPPLTDYTAIVVLKKDAVNRGVDEKPFAQGWDRGFTIYRHGNTPNMWGSQFASWHKDINITTAETVSSEQNWFIIGSRHNFAGQKHDNDLNGQNLGPALVYTPKAPGPQTVKAGIGASNVDLNSNCSEEPFGGDIAEVIFYRYNLSATERNFIYCHLGNKYGISIYSGITCP